MKSILMSINSLHNENIESGLKGSELRTRPPKLDPPFKVYTYESGTLGRHKVVNEWICPDMITWRMCMGIPAHLSKTACVTDGYIWKYSNSGYKDITEMKISELVIYEKPKELSEFRYYNPSVKFENGFPIPTHEIKRPPQSWCYVEALKGGAE